MTCYWRWAACMALLACITACQARGPATAAKAPKPEASQAPVAIDASPIGVDWASAGDCRGMLGLLKRALDDGRIKDLDGTPFLLIDEGPASRAGRWPISGRRFDQDMRPVSSSNEARCILRVGHADDRRSEHRVLDREQVRSRYQSGTRSEKNPAYDVAKARLRQAEKAAKPGKSSIIKVGDPLIDLMGTLVGGALTGLGQWGAGDQLEEALDALMATPPSIQHPKYSDYHFERARVRASREATLPVILTDRRLQQSWQASLKRREHRELFVVTGLDRQDENHARHSENSLTKDGLRQWLAEAPSLPLVDMVAVLQDRPSSTPIDRLALVDKTVDPADLGTPAEDVPLTEDVPFAWNAPPKGEAPLAVGGPLAGDALMDAAALPPSFLSDIGHDAMGQSPPEGSAPASRIAIIGETARAEGIYIAPHFILTPSEIIGERGLVDIEDRPGHVALGMVAAVDHGLGLALVHVPSPGRPIAVRAEPEAPRQTWLDKAGQTATSSSNRGENTAILADGQLIGFTTARGPNIESDAISTFLDRQKHLLPMPADRPKKLSRR